MSKLAKSLKYIHSRINRYVINSKTIDDITIDIYINLYRHISNYCSELR